MRELMAADEQAEFHPPEDIRTTDWTRSQTLVGGSPCFSAAEATPTSGRTSPPTGSHPAVTSGTGSIRTGPAEEPTLLYGGGRNAPLTLVKATLVKSLEVAGSDPSGGAGSLPALASVIQKASSLYASCYSDDHSSADEFRSANTSFDDPDPLMGSNYLLFN